MITTHHSQTYMKYYGFEKRGAGYVQSNSNARGNETNGMNNNKGNNNKPNIVSKRRSDSSSGNYVNNRSNKNFSKINHNNFDRGSKSLSRNFKNFNRNNNAINTRNQHNDNYRTNFISNKKNNPGVNENQRKNQNNTNQYNTNNQYNNNESQHFQSNFHSHYRAAQKQNRFNENFKNNTHGGNTDRNRNYYVSRESVDAHSERRGSGEGSKENNFSQRDRNISRDRFSEQRNNFHGRYDWNDYDQTDNSDTYAINRIVLHDEYDRDHDERGDYNRIDGFNHRERKGEFYVYDGELNGYDIQNYKLNDYDRRAFGDRKGWKHKHYNRSNKSYDHDLPLSSSSKRRHDGEISNGKFMSTKKENTHELIVSDDTRQAFKSNGISTKDNENHNDDTFEYHGSNTFEYPGNYNNKHPDDKNLSPSKLFLDVVKNIRGFSTESDKKDNWRRSSSNYETKKVQGYDSSIDAKTSKGRFNFFSDHTRSSQVYGNIIDRANESDVDSGTSDFRQLDMNHTVCQDSSSVPMNTAAFSLPISTNQFSEDLLNTLLLRNQQPGGYFSDEKKPYSGDEENKVHNFILESFVKSSLENGTKGDKTDSLSHFMKKLGVTSDELKKYLEEELARRNEIDILQTTLRNLYRDKLLENVFSKSPLKHEAKYIANMSRIDAQDEAIKKDRETLSLDLVYEKGDILDDYSVTSRLNSKNDSNYLLNLVKSSEFTKQRSFSASTNGKSHENKPSNSKSYQELDRKDHCTRRSESLVSPKRRRIQSPVRSDKKTRHKSQISSQRESGKSRNDTHFNVAKSLSPLRMEDEMPNDMKVLIKVNEGILQGKEGQQTTLTVPNNFQGKLRNIPPFTVVPEPIAIRGFNLSQSPNSAVSQQSSNASFFRSATTPTSTSCLPPMDLACQNVSTQHDNIIHIHSNSAPCAITSDLSSIVSELQTNKNKLDEMSPETHMSSQENNTKSALESDNRKEINDTIDKTLSMLKRESKTKSSKQANTSVGMSVNKLDDNEKIEDELTITKVVPSNGERKVNNQAVTGNSVTSLTNRTLNNKHSASINKSRTHKLPTLHGRKITLKPKTTKTHPTKLAEQNAELGKTKIRVPSWFNGRCIELLKKRHKKMKEIDRLKNDPNATDERLGSLKESLRDINREYIPLVKKSKSEYMET